VLTNERPNCYTYSYITAGCTDGKTYVWDTARGDRPIHILHHGDSVEELRGDREREDVGIKFTAWGTTLDRFYTGSSDGVVKVWNVRSTKNPFVRNLLEAPAPISCGAFSPDRTKLLVGDASGRIFMLSLNEDDQRLPYQNPRLPAAVLRRMRAIPIDLHPDPPAPLFDADGRPSKTESGPSRAAAFLRSGQLQLHPHPTIGAVQGPRYAETGLFNRGLHLGNDPEKPLLAKWEIKQQEARRVALAKRSQLRGLLRPLQEDLLLERKHWRNASLDQCLDTLELETRLELEAEKADLAPEEDYDFTYDDDRKVDDGF